MLTGPLNAYLARALRRSPRALELCAALEGKRLRLEIEGVPGALELTVAHSALRVHAERAAEVSGTPDVVLHGSPLGLLALAGNDPSDVVMRGQVSLQGEEALAQQFQELARLLRPDLEAIMGKVVGRIPAHLANRAFTQLADWSRATGASAARNVADYLAHESRDLVPRAEAEGCFAGVETLRSEVTRAEQRVAQLAERLAALPRNAS